MPYTIACTAVLTATVESVWATWADLPAYPSWDAREEHTRLDGPFATGTTGYSKQTGRGGSTFVLTLVEPMCRWINELPLPGGKLVIDHTLAVTGQGQVRVSKTYIAHGPLAAAFRFWFARGIRAEMPGSFAALEAEAARRVRA